MLRMEKWLFYKWKLVAIQIRKMRNYLILGLLTLCSIVVFSQETIPKNSFTAKWDNGFKIENTNKTISLKFGGRIMYDFGFFSLNSEEH